MNSGRKRRVRLVVCLALALALAAGLIYTSFSAAAQALSPTQLLREAKPGVTYQLTGTVVAGSVRLPPRGPCRRPTLDRGALQRRRPRPVPRWP